MFYLIFQSRGRVIFLDSLNQYNTEYIYMWEFTDCRLYKDSMKIEKCFVCSSCLCCSICELATEHLHRHAGSGSVPSCLHLYVLGLLYALVWMCDCKRVWACVRVFVHGQLCEAAGPGLRLWHSQPPGSCDSPHTLEGGAWVVMFVARGGGLREQTWDTTGPPGAVAMPVWAGCTGWEAAWAGAWGAITTGVCCGAVTAMATGPFWKSKEETER